MRRLVALLGLAAMIAGGAPARAHTGGSTGYASIAVDGATIRYTLTLWPAGLPPAVAEDIRLARSGDASSRDRLLGHVREKVVVSAQGQRCAPGPGRAGPPAPDAESITLVVDFACAEVVRALAVRDDLFDALGADYHTLARIDAPDGSRPFAFTPETREARVQLGSGAGAGGFWSFVRLGVEHILTGWDHLLFLLALLLPGGGWLPVLKIITAFTLAHSITLALAALNVVALPDRAIEAVIALSIALVAAENLSPRPAVTRRWIVSFAFGLVHGFGFSSVLREIGLPADALLRSLFGFNVGVELGQALVVAVVLPALALVRRTGWERRMIWGSSAAILVVGLALFAERALW
ncbi:MAG: HupE/UreJ family protein [Candidatus Rokubacteria bacterium]|nr:HupE/UreJ family protein [Candidatus Rokubacteria bacterium]